MNEYPRYIILTARTAESLALGVREKMRLGYEPTGGVCASHNTENYEFLYQAMILPKIERE